MTIQKQKEQNAQVDLLLSYLPVAESSVVKRFVGHVAGHPRRQRDPYVIETAKRAKGMLEGLRRQGIVDYKETFSKDGNRVIKREWFKIEKGEHGGKQQEDPKHRQVQEEGQEIGEQLQELPVGEGTARGGETSVPCVLREEGNQHDAENQGTDSQGSGERRHTRLKLRKFIVRQSDGFYELFSGKEPPRLLETGDFTVWKDGYSGDTLECDSIQSLCDKMFHTFSSLRLRKGEIREIEDIQFIVKEVE